MPSAEPARPRATRMARGTLTRRALVVLLAVAAAVAWPRRKGAATEPAPPAPLPPPPTPPPFPPRTDCVLFAYMGRGMHSNFALMASRIAGLARSLGCRALPLFITHGPGDGDWDRPDTPLGAFYGLDPPSDAFVDLAVDAALVRDAARSAGANVPSGAAGPVADRASLGLHQYRNEQNRTLGIPCLVGTHSLEDPRARDIKQPFRCSELVVLEDWATHPESADPRRREQGVAVFRSRFQGRLVGLPQPFMLNLSCALEQQGAAEVPPRPELLRAAKWVLWNGILSGPAWTGFANSDWEAHLLARLNASGGIPDLDSPAYARYPDPATSYLSGHVRTASNHFAFCSHRMRFPLCATTDGAAAASLASAVDEWRASGSRGTLSLFVAGDTLRPPPLPGTKLQRVFGTPSQIVADRLSAASAACPRPPLVRYGASMGPLYRAVLSHPSLNFTHVDAMPARHGTGREAAFFDVAGIVLDQILLGCGDVVSRNTGARGAFLQTYWSTFSVRARSLGATVGARVCVPSGGPPAAPAAEPGMTPAELAAQDAEIARAGVDFSVEHAYHLGPRRTEGPADWALGCMAKGSFFPSLGFRERMGMEVPCGHCGAEGRW